jgi:alcohol dehydrogenase class IV
VGYPVRVHAGEGALDELPDAVRRAGAKRAFVVSGRTVSRAFPLIDGIEARLGALCAGSFDEVEKDTTIASVMRATDAAEAAGADQIVAVGGGSLMQAGRIVAILMAEKRPLEELVTQYPEGAPAISAWLMEPKLPIINVVTTPTTAMNRGGSPAKSARPGHRYEFFDPKTRPVALFWDPDALMTATPELTRSAAVNTYLGMLGRIGVEGVNDVAAADREAAQRIMQKALPHVLEHGNAEHRVALCAAAFLYNRAEDDGAPLRGTWSQRVSYALATALHLLYPDLGQGEATSAVLPQVMRALGERDPGAAGPLSEALGIPNQGGPSPSELNLRSADALERQLERIGMPTRLSATGIVRREDLQIVLEGSLQNYNADPTRRMRGEKDFLGEVLESCW